jgi:hypothetical protein
MRISTPSYVDKANGRACLRVLQALLVGLDFKFFPDPLPLRRDAFLSVTEFLSNFLVSLSACESPQQLLLARAD